MFNNANEQARLIKHNCALHCQTVWLVKMKINGCTREGPSFGADTSRVKQDVAHFLIELLLNSVRKGPKRLNQAAEPIAELIELIAAYE